MRNPHLSLFALSLLAGLLLVAGAHRIQAQQASSKTPELAGNKPEAFGFSSERLERLHAVMEQEVDEKQLAGVGLRNPALFMPSASTGALYEARKAVDREQRETPRKFQAGVARPRPASHSTHPQTAAT